MNWSVVAIWAAIAVGFIGFCLMMAAFVLVGRQGGWSPAMQSEPHGRWSLARRLLFAGACLGAIFCGTVLILFLIPGGIPWREGSDWGNGIAAVLPGLFAVWYFIIRRPQNAARRSEQSNAGR
jgi:hypothetical protein